MILGSMLDHFWEHFGMCSTVFCDHFLTFRRCFAGISGMFRGCFGDVFITATATNMAPPTAWPITLLLHTDVTL